MNSVGNDNYRPNVVPPNPIRKKTGWLSSNMALLMVFINGLILTVTAYATLSVFIQEIVKEDFLKTTNEIQEHVTESFQSVEKNFLLLSDFVDVVGTNEQNLFSKLKDNFLISESFEDLFLIKNTQSDKTITSVLMGKDSTSQWKETLLSEKVLDDNTNNKIRVFSSNDTLKFDENIFLMVRKLGSGSYFVGLMSKAQYLDASWLKKRKNLHSLRVVNQDEDIDVLSYIASPVSNKNKNIQYYTSLFEYVFAGQAYDVRLNLKMGRREAFLQKIPILMLLFGMTLTLIGTLYVRNNQRQSQKLSSMNKELAHKNYELSHQISERERLNKHIQKSEQENRAIINSVTDIIFEVDQVGTILFLNDSWEKVTGFDLSRSLGRNLFNLMHKKDQKEQDKNFKDLIKGRIQTYRTFSKIRSVDGRYRSVEVVFSMLKQGENQDIRAVGTITDVEERRRAEQALAEAESKYRTIVENSASGIYQVTAEGQFLSVNPSYANILGYETPEEILRDVSHAHEDIYVDATMRSQILRDIENLATPKNFEIQVYKKNKDIVWISENIRPVLDDGGEVLFYEGSIENIDARKKAEIALREAKIESDLANRSKSEFLANMSHELRTPLNSVIGFAEIIKNEVFGKLPNPEYKEYATSIFDSGKDLLNVINEILNVSHIETGSRDLKEAIVSVKDVVDSCLDMVKGKAAHKKINIDNKVQDKTLKVVGESDAIKQMLLNLLSNAIRFSPDRAYIMVDAEIDDKGGLCISITDTGIGLTESELEKALSPFGQVDTEHNRDGSGTGLGLTLVKSLIELHGGDFDMVSQKNIGTTATITFPKKRVPRQEIEIEAEKKQEEA